MVALRMADRALGLVSLLILARLLIPADFGLVAMAMSIVAMLELMSAFGFDVVLIQRQQETRDDFDTAWTFNLIFRLVTGVGLALLASSSATFYEEPRLEPMLYWLALAVAIPGFANIGTVTFRKSFQFHKEFTFRFGRNLISFVITVPLAFWLRNYWALVLGILAANTALVILSYVLHPYRPRLSLASARSLFDFSKWLILQNLLFFSTDAPYTLWSVRWQGPEIWAFLPWPSRYRISSQPSSRARSTPRFIRATPS